MTIYFTVDRSRVSVFVYKSDSCGTWVKRDRVYFWWNGRYFIAGSV